MHRKKIIFNLTILLSNMVELHHVCLNIILALSRISFFFFAWVFFKVCLLGLSVAVFLIKLGWGHFLLFGQIW